MFFRAELSANKLKRSGLGRQPYETFIHKT